MSVLAHFLLAMIFPVASVTLGAWLIWRRSQRRYTEWLEADNGMTFGQWLRSGK